MLPLAGAAIPDSPESLAIALRAGFQARGFSVSAAEARGGWPQLEALALDLTGTALDELPPLPEADQDQGSGFSAERFSLRATPAQFRSAPITVALEASDAAFAFAKAGADSVAQFTGAVEGRIEVEVAHAALEGLVQRFAADAAGEHGVEIKNTRLTLSPRGNRGLSVVAEVTARAFIASATLTISGDAEIDENLVARLSNLRFHGDGMIANLAGAVIRPVLAQAEGRTFPLIDFALGGVRVRDVAIEAGDPLRIVAKFGR